MSESDKEMGKRHRRCLRSGEGGLVTLGKVSEKVSLVNGHWRAKSLSRKEHSRHNSQQEQKP